MKNQSNRDFSLEIEELRIKLDEAQETLSAIRRGAVDAILISTPKGDRIYTLKSAEQPYRVFFEEMNEAGVTMTFDGNILFSNRSFSDLLNIPLSKILGSDFLTFIEETEKDSIRKMIARAKKHKLSRESAIRLADGQVIPVNISLSRLRTEDLKAVCAIITDLRDVVTLKKLEELNEELAVTNEELTTTVEELRTYQDALRASEEAVKKKNLELDRSNRELEGFIYSTSHDLRAPVRHIAGFAELLKQESWQVLSEEGRNHLQTVSAAALKLGIMMDELLRFSRLGRSEIKKTSVDLNLIVKNTISMLKEGAGLSSIDWVVGSLPSVMGDPTLLELVFTNLISNALKFTRKKRRARIEIGYNQNKDHYIVHVKDNGIGFNMAFYDKLFRVFHRLHNDKGFEGTGIGLANVQRIIHRHRGRVWAEGKVNEGATFYFSLPKGKVS